MLDGQGNVVRIDEFAIYGKSLMYILKSIGASKDPRGKPLFRRFIWLVDVPRWTVNRRLLIISFNNVYSVRHEKNCRSFAIRPICQTVSYAAERQSKFLSSIGNRLQ